MKPTDVYQKILTTAEHFTQTRGFNAFSYRDISQVVGIKTSSIHYYFPTKADLGKEIIKMHVNTLLEELDKLMLNKTLSSRRKLEIYIDTIVAKTYLSERKMCLGGMLASDVLTLPDVMQKEVRNFFNHLANWLKKLIKEGIQQNEFIALKNINKEVMLIFSTLEGALLLARLFQDQEYLATARNNIISCLT